MENPEDNQIGQQGKAKEGSSQCVWKAVKKTEQKFSQGVK